MIAPVVNGHAAVIGEKGTIMGDVMVGESATLLPRAAIFPDARIGPFERGGGAPAPHFPGNMGSVDGFPE
jgi:carbonic anhydrase/acetyltransferase-like protein (isoleucine patch superfamily)